MYSAIITMNMSAIKLNTVFELMYCSVRLVSRAWAALTFKSEMARRSPSKRPFRILNKVKAAPTIIPPTAIGRTM